MRRLLAALLLVALSHAASAQPPKPGADARAWLQQRVDAAAAAGGGDVVLAGPYRLSGPIDMRGSGVRLLGSDNARLESAPGYSGPLLTFGHPAAGSDFTAAYRPPAPTDASVAPGSKFGFDTKGQSCLAITGHPLQSGLVRPDGSPDFWATTDPLTVDVMVERRAGIADTAALAGLSDDNLNPMPWVLLFRPGGFGLFVAPADPSVPSVRVNVTCPTAPGVYRLSVQFDPKTGKANAWVNRKAVPAAFDPGNPWTPGVPLKRHDGFRPFQIGSYGNLAWHPRQYFTDTAIGGLRVSRCAVYQWDNPNQTTAVGGRPVNDAVQFYTTSPEVMPPGCLGLLPLDAPTDGRPWLKVDGGQGGAMAWLPVGGNVTAGNLTVRDLTLNGSASAPAMLIFQTFSLNLDGVTASGTQGLGTMPIGGSWPSRFENCTFTGSDAGAVLWQHIGSFRDLNVPQAGAHAVRARSGVVGFERTFVGRVSPATASIFRFVGDDDGGEWTVRNLVVDNEDFAGSPTEAVVSAVAGTWHGGALILEDINVSRVDGPASFVRLDGIGVRGSNRQLAEVRAKGLRSYLGCQTGLTVAGLLHWQGTFDQSSLAPAAAGASRPVAPAPPAAMIRVTPFAASPP